ncbi:MAG: type II CRISPR RNA-guided endonuclease Cas9 [Lachnospirales bacterium]
MENYSLGLDIGIASIGWAVIGLNEKTEPTHIAETGVVLVESMEDKEGNLANGKRRAERGARRTGRREKFRILRTKDLLSSTLGINDYEKIYGQHKCVYEIKVKGLEESLTKEELSVALLHYVKHRGFKSNRKSDDADNEDGKILTALEQNEKRLNGRYISQLILEELDGITPIRNAGGVYNFSFKREEYKKEIVALLDKQIESNVINEDFKDSFIEIWESQRDFSEGPGGDSCYKVEYGKVFGYCSFRPDELRAPRLSPSQEINSLLGKLINIRYKHIDSIDNYVSLTPAQIKKGLDLLLSKSEIKYSHVVDLIMKYPDDVQCSLLKDDIKNKVKKKELRIMFKSVKISKMDYGKLKRENPNADDREFQCLVQGKVQSITLLKLTGINEMRKAFKACKKEELFNDLLTNDIKYLDDIAKCFTFYKTANRIDTYFKGIETERVNFVSDLDWGIYPVVIEQVIPLIKSKEYKESASLSLSLLYELNELMVDGIPYHDAMKQLGYEHNTVTKEVTPKKKLPLMVKILDEQYKNEISNPRVVRVLCRLQSLVNSVIDKYGSPYFINIEVARDINLKRGKRSILENEQLENLSKNERIKSKLSQELGISYNYLSKYDIEKYKLYEEQGGICPYSLNSISYSDILSADYEVDHIKPFSLSNDNTYNNKVLVYKKANQEKSNTVPLEYFSKSTNHDEDFIKRFKNYVNNAYLMSDNKKANLLMKSANDIEKGMTERDLVETRFITKYIMDIFNRNLIFADSVKTNNVAYEVRTISQKAGYVNMLKKALSMVSLTHSYESYNYEVSYLWKLNNIGIKKVANKWEATFSVIDHKNEKRTEDVSFKELNIGDKTPNNIVYKNEMLTLLCDNLHKIDIDRYIGTTIVKQHKSLLNAFDEIEKDNSLCVVVHRELDITLKDVLIYNMSLLKAELTKKEIKNRDNHLHHALDACCIGALTRSQNTKIVKYMKDREKILEALGNYKPLQVSSGEAYVLNFESEFNELIVNKKNLTFYGAKMIADGIIIETQSEFLEKEHLFLGGMFPEPFVGFKNEVLAFVYEQDLVTQKNMINDQKCRSLKPLIPVVKQKRRYEIKDDGINFKGLHKETIYGITKDGTFLTKRVSISDLNSKAIEKIVYKDTTNKHVYEACKNWLENKIGDYPKLSNGRDIKKVTITSNDAERAFKVERGYVLGDGIAYIDIYAHPTSNKLHACAMFTFQLVEKYNSGDCEVALWSGSNSKKYKLSEIESDFTHLCKLHPGDLIELEKNDGCKGLVYVVGFTGGKLEVRDLLGDNYRISKTMGSNSKTQIFISISSIKSIQKKKINIRGDIK